MTTESPDPHQRKFDGTDQNSQPRTESPIYAAGKILIIRCAGQAFAPELAMHESFLERSSPAFQALIHRHRTATDTVVLPGLRGGTRLWTRGSAALDNYVHFLYTREIRISKPGEGFAALVGLMEEWLMGLFLRDARYCNAIMDTLIQSGDGGQAFLLLAVGGVFRDGLEGERGTPLWKWVVEHVGATLSREDLDGFCAGESAYLLNSFLVDLLRRVLEQSKGLEYRRAPMLTDSETYYLAEDTIAKVWEAYSRDA